MNESDVWPLVSRNSVGPKGYTIKYKSPPHIRFEPEGIIRT